MTSYRWTLIAVFSTVLALGYRFVVPGVAVPSGEPTPLIARHDAAAGTITVSRVGEERPLVTQHVRPDFRPYLHPIVAPDGRGAFTELSPEHHRHQTGLYWGFTRVNGRDFFHNPGATHWRRVSARIVEERGPLVIWETVYDLLGEAGETVLTETQIWSMREENGRYLLDLEWRGEAKTDVTIGRYDYGGLFLRMPWRPGRRGGVSNAARQRDQAAEGKRAMWLDVGIEVEGREDQAHVAIFDHPENAGYPQPWRVDAQMGVGPARARLGDWRIPRGRTEVIRHRLLFYTGTLSDVELLEQWESYSGARGQYSTTALWQLARDEARTATFLSPEQAAASMTLLDGFQVNAWAGEPMVTQPMAFAWDDRGRLWVAENRDYESRGGGFSASGDSRIVILEDTDRDGRADSRKVFLEGIPFPSAIAIGFDGLFLGAPPHLLFVPDRNRDDVADRADIQIRLTGWGIQDRHETLNSLHWGPDGWLYGLEGFATPSRVRRPTARDRLYARGDSFPEREILAGEGTPIDGGVWRYHPTKDRFEVVAHGFSNPWGIDHDAKGQLFITACVIPHVFHVIPGGIYQRQGGQHFNPYVYSDIGHIVDHRHRSAHGGARVYQSDAFPAGHRGRLFMANIHEHAVLSDVLEPRGSGFVASHGDDLLMANNAQWVGFSVEVGPEGALYVLDWHDPDLTGGQVLGKNTGRIFRITPKQSLARDWPDRYSDLAKASDARLAELQLSESDWHARRARVILQHRATTRRIDPAAEGALRRLFERHANPDLRLRAMWALHVTGLLGQDRLLTALEDAEPYVRGWAIQLLTEDGDPGAGAVSAFARLARSDDSPVVRKYLAAALQRLDRGSRWEVAAGLLQHDGDSDDHNIPRLLWYGIEPLVAADPERALTLASGSAIPAIPEFVARRAVDADRLEPLLAALRQHAPARLALLRGMLAGVRGRGDVQAPTGWAALVPALEADGAARPLAREIEQSFGDAGAARRNLATLRDPAAPVEQRRVALASLARQQRPEVVDELPSLIAQPALRIEALRAVAAYDRRPLGELVLKEYPRFGPAEKREAIQALASRPTYGRLLTEALKAGGVPRTDVAADVARQLRRVVGVGFVEVWGPIDLDSGAEQAAYAKYRALLSAPALARADPSRGRRVFQRTCGSCHRMYDEGGDIGPELTGTNRGNLEYLLSNVLRPSEVIQDDYRLVVITMRDGRTHSGNIVAETDRQVTLRVVGQNPRILDKPDIQSREVSGVSLMPDGLMRTLTDDQVLDLMAYLRTTEQVPPPAN